MEVRWTIKAYSVGDGETVIDEWSRSASPKAVAKFDTRIRFLSDRHIAEWTYDYAHKLKGCDGIWEIKFETDNIAYRPLFFFGPGNSEITLLYFAKEHNYKLRPKGAIRSAIARMNEILANPIKATNYDY